MGDFNQVVGPGGRAPATTRSALRECFSSDITIAIGPVTFQGRRSIDHIALSEDLAVERVEVTSNMIEERELSDHFGVGAELSRRWSRRRGQATEHGEVVVERPPAGRVRLAGKLHSERPLEPAACLEQRPTAKRAPLAAPPVDELTVPGDERASPRQEGALPSERHSATADEPATLASASVPKCGTP